MIKAIIFAIKINYFYYLKKVEFLTLIKIYVLNKYKK